MKRLIALTIAASALAGVANAQEIVRGGDPKSPIASVVTVPAGYDTIYVSGMTPPVIDDKATGVARFGDTKDPDPRRAGPYRGRAEDPRARPWPTS